MKLGAITIPVDDTFPESYIQAIINISAPKYIIQESDYVFNNVESIQLNSLKTKKTANLTEIDVDVDDTALIMYTSGSTGIPKGVEITQRNIININPLFTVDIFVQAFGIVILVGIIGGLYPAMKAVKLPPTEALKYE